MKRAFRLAFPIMAALVIYSASTTAIARAADAAPAVADIRAAAARTKQRLSENGASWTAVHTVGTFEFRVDVVVTPRVRASTYTIGGQQLARVIERDGVWYVDEDGRAYKCRPSEFPFKLASLSIFRNRSDVKLLTDVDDDALGAFQRRDGDVAYYRSPVDAAARRTLEGMIRQYDELAKADPAGVDRNPKAKAQMTSMKDALKSGLPVEVDMKNGLLALSSNLKMSTRFESFRWAEGDEVSIANGTREDISGGPLAGSDPNDLVIVLYSAVNADAGGHIWNMKTGRMWRIPLDTDETGSGCFLPGRRSVVAIGAQAGAFVPYEVNLDTLATRQLGGELFARGIAMTPVPSPDGKTLATGHLDLGEGFMSKQVYLIDVASGNAKPLGKPFDVTHMQWHPGGRSLIIERIEPGPLNAISPRSICRMDLNGDVSVLRGRSSSPVVLATRQRIIFRDDDAKLWKTCDLDGKDEPPFGKALEDFFFPTVSPDEKRIMMMHNVPGRGPTPYVFDMGALPGEPATSDRGFWATPSWR